MHLLQISVRFRRGRLRVCPRTDGDPSVVRWRTRHYRTLANQAVSIATAVGQLAQTLPRALAGPTFDRHFDRASIE